MPSAGVRGYRGSAPRFGRAPSWRNPDFPPGPPDRARISRLLAALAKADLLILDDWGLAPLTDRERRDLLEVLEDRYGRRATLVTSQLPIEHWHACVGDPTFGDAILDRLVHQAHRLTLKGTSMRRRETEKTKSTDTH